jgi:hypothetical protein
MPALLTGAGLLLAADLTDHQGKSDHFPLSKSVQFPAPTDVENQPVDSSARKPLLHNG